MLRRIYVHGLDEIPWRCRCGWEDAELVVDRPENESGRVVVPWRVLGRGEYALATATLIERERPYLLEVELARGGLNELRNQIAAWEMAGLVVPANIRDRLAEATKRFSIAATRQEEVARSAELACGTIDQVAHLAGDLAACYTHQAIQVRRRATPQLSTLLGVNLGTRIPHAETAGHLAGAFNLAVVPFAWKTIEAVEGKRRWDDVDHQVDWCSRTGIKVCGGPLLQLDVRGVPDWMYLWENEPDNLLSFMLDHVKAVVRRYRGRVHLWQAVARCNAASPLGLDEEQSLRLVVHVIELIRDLDPNTPIVVLFDQPWSEYMADRDYDLTPLSFADTLVRAELGLAGVGFEINAGVWPGGTPHRTPLAYSRLIDQWSLLGVPLVVSLCTPSGAMTDDRAASPSRVLRSTNPDMASPARQKRWADTILPLLLAKSGVQVILWNQLDDAAPHDFPHGGLIDPEWQTQAGAGGHSVVAATILVVTRSECVRGQNWYLR